MYRAEFEHDEAVRACYVRLENSEGDLGFSRTVDLGYGVMVDLDGNGDVCGVEVLY